MSAPHVLVPTLEPRAAQGQVHNPPVCAPTPLPSPHSWPCPPPPPARSPAVPLQLLGLVRAVEELALEQLHGDDGEDEHEEHVHDEDVEHVLERVHHAVEHGLGAGRLSTGPAGGTQPAARLGTPREGGVVSDVSSGWWGKERSHQAGASEQGPDPSRQDWPRGQGGTRACWCRQDKQAEKQPRCVSLARHVGMLYGRRPGPAPPLSGPSACPALVCWGRSIAAPRHRQAPLQHPRHLPTQPSGCLLTPQPALGKLPHNPCSLSPQARTPSCSQHLMHRLRGERVVSTEHPPSPRTSATTWACPAPPTPSASGLSPGSPAKGPAAGNARPAAPQEPDGAHGTAGMALMGRQTGEGPSPTWCGLFSGGAPSALLTPPHAEAAAGCGQHAQTHMLVHAPRAHMYTHTQDTCALARTAHVHAPHAPGSHLELGQPLDGLERPQDAQHPQGLDGVDVLPFGASGRRADMQAAGRTRRCAHAAARPGRSPPPCLSWPRAEA